MVLTVNNPSIAPSPQSSVFDAYDIKLLNVLIARFYPDGVIELAGGFVKRVVQSNSFSAGNLVTIGSPWILADSAFDNRPTHGMVADASTDEFFVSIGGFVSIPSHGKGSEGDILWSSTTGNTVTERPTSGALNFQRVGTVLDASIILLNIEHGVGFSS